MCRGFYHGGSRTPSGFSSSHRSYTLPRMDNASETRVKVRANSPGRYPILIVELPGGELRATYFETDYDLGRAKTVEEEWLQGNAIGRHGFLETDPPREMPAAGLAAYARQELLGT